MKPFKPLDLHLVSWNRFPMTELVIKAIHRNTQPGTFKLHVLDNGSDGDVPQKLEELRDAGFIHDLLLFKTNMGLEGARNILLQNATESEYFVCIDNDCIPQPFIGEVDWLELLVDLMERYEDFAAISCRTQVMIGTGNIFEEADAAGDDIIEFPWPGGSLRIMRSDIVRRVGGWDRNAPGRGGEERYIAEKLHNDGYRTAFAVNIKTLHLFGLRGKNSTDRWGYDISLKPEDTGHSDISHPALTNGDDIDEVAVYAGEELAYDYGSH